MVAFIWLLGFVAALAAIPNLVAAAVVIIAWTLLLAYLTPEETPYERYKRRGKF